MLQIINAYICQLITTIGMFVFCNIVLDKKIKNSKITVLLCLFIVTLTETLIYIKLDGIIKSIIMLMINSAFYNYIFKINVKKSIIISFIYAIIVLSIEILQFCFITEIFKLSKNFGKNIYGKTIISNFITSLFLIVLSYLLRKKINKIINTKIENNIKIITFSILILICSSAFFYTLIERFTLTGNNIIYLIAIIVLFLVLFSLIKQTIENNKLTLKYEKLLEFMTGYENEIEKQRILRHETKNEFLTIKSKIKDKQNNKEIIKYIDEILKDKITVKQEEYAKFGYLPANGIKGLCYFKTQEAQEKKLNTSINISKRICNSSIYKLDIKEQRDLGKILGVILDNAIEAAKKTSEKKIGFEAYLNINKDCQIIVSNSFDGEIDLEKIGKEKFSTKGKNRGHGLLLVSHIINKNKIFGIKTDVVNGLYVQTITIKNKEAIKK